MSTSRKMMIRGIVAGICLWTVGVWTPTAVAGGRDHDRHGRSHHKSVHHEDDHHDRHHKARHDRSDHRHGRHGWSFGFRVGHDQHGRHGNVTVKAHRGHHHKLRRHRSRETRAFRVWVPGYYTHSVRWECVSPGYSVKRFVRVWVPGRWEHRRRSCAVPHRSVFHARAGFDF